MIMLVCPGEIPFTKISLGLTATASAMSAATDTRSIVTGLSTTSDFPTLTNKSRGDVDGVCCAAA
jgi:hypothetical protein